MAPETTDAQSLPALIAIAVGNSRTRAGVFRGDDIVRSWVEPDSALETIVARCREDIETESEHAGARPPVVVSTVAPRVSGPLVDGISSALGPGAVYRIGSDLPVPMTTALDDEGVKTVGQDRLLTALGAYSIAQSACVVVDAGTAVTIDFVDGEGVFHGGAIAPGAAMMLKALHEHTEQLPELTFAAPPEDLRWGANTPDAMRLGVTLAIRGVVRAAAERYALAFGAYPAIIGTGGDVGLLEAEGIVEHTAPDLQLLGIRAACVQALAPDASPDAE